MTYEVRDTLSLWWLADPRAPALIGELRLLKTGTRGVSLSYAGSWIDSGIALSEDLPLIDLEFMPQVTDTAVGAVDDARPDRWGERVIRLLDRPARASLMEMLYFAGDDRFGALGVSTSATEYRPRLRGALPRLEDVETIQTLVSKVINHEPVAEAQRRLIDPGATFGGARPKALIALDGTQWIVKFAEDAWSKEPLVEHAAMTLAALAGIEVATTRALPLPRGAAVLVRRFDRAADGSRRHALSAHTALRAAAFADPSYPDLAQLLRRRGPTVGGFNGRQMEELFRRLIFNILIDNTDDHEKNHVLLVDERQQYTLSPAFDVLPTGQALGTQRMIVGEDGVESTIDNALSMCRAYGMRRPDAEEQVRRVATVVDGWRLHFLACGVPPDLIDTFGQHIDRPALTDQRTRYLSPAPPRTPVSNDPTKNGLPLTR